MNAVLKDPQLCTGCAACEASCGTHAISMVPNEEGFLYPSIDANACTECKLCERICPVNPEHPKDLFHHEPQEFLAAWNKDEEIRRQSSSGGVFTALAENILEQGGAVVGAAFDESFKVRHIMIENKDELAKLRGSKYVQSEVSSALYGRIKSELRDGRKILFSGTPCQVAGMRQVMRKQEGILYVDILCHGVPSPKLWEEYRATLNAAPSSFSFRDKITGWKDYSISWLINGSVHKELGRDNAYMHAFLRDYTLRMACYACSYAKMERVGDLTLADFWGIEKCYPEYDDDKGTGLVLVNDSHGRLSLAACSDVVIAYPVSSDAATLGNPIFRGPSHRPAARGEFYNKLSSGGFASVAKIYALGLPSALQRFASKFKRTIKMILIMIGVKR